MPAVQLPEIPAPIKDFIPYIKENGGQRITDLLKPYRAFDSRLRELYAQDRENPILQDMHFNVVPIYAGHEADILTRARTPETEPASEREKYIMPLSADKRRPNGAAAIQPSLRDFQNSFSIFSEGALADLEWDNVVVAGSAAVTPLMPVPKEYRGSKKAMRKYYHEVIAPASDVDLFLYGLSEEDALKKIETIEANIRDAILSEATVVRTKYAITIASKYPTRHIQIVLRVYSSISEILTGFDVDCACAAYDGSQVYASPRALAAYMTQINEIDLSRRSPSYENRLSKYSRRGFEVYWQNLDRSKVDPTIFERTFPRTVGLARLLVLETLPSSDERESYLNQRRTERGRPPAPSRSSNNLFGNIKGEWEDEIAEWVDQEEISSYHTFTVPYGPRFDAKKIEKLLYTKDLLLNAEWNTPKYREVHLHRHPAFFGRVRDVVKDCCCECPVPVTLEEKETAKKEAEIYISGPLKFIMDNPGRQQIGSFNPLTEDDWTEMAYVSDTTRLCHAIVSKDTAAVEEWLSADGADPNLRDYTGRTPLHLAAMTSSPEVVKCLVDHRARIVARLADGQTALHIASARGDTAIIKILLDKSEENEEIEAEKESRRKAEVAKESPPDNLPALENLKLEEEKKSSGGPTEDGFDKIGSEEDDGFTIHTATSYLKVDKRGEQKESEGAVPEENTEDPDVYNVNVLTWDSPCSPLHLAIVNGHLDAVKLLVSEYGADVLLPVKIVDSTTREVEDVILPLVLALMTPGDRIETMSRLLLELGATPMQADNVQATPILYAVVLCKQLIDIYVSSNKASFKAALDYVSVGGSKWQPTSFTPLSTAVKFGDLQMVKKLLSLGAKPNIEYNRWSRTVRLLNADAKETYEHRQYTMKAFREEVVQPIAKAIDEEKPEIALELLANGADPNSLSDDGIRILKYTYERNYRNGKTILDSARAQCEKLEDIINNLETSTAKYNQYNALPIGPVDHYFSGLDKKSFQYWRLKRSLRRARTSLPSKKSSADQDDFQAMLLVKKERVHVLLDSYRALVDVLLSKNAKGFYELHENIPRLRKDDGEEKERTKAEKEQKENQNKYQEFKFTIYGKMSDQEDDFLREGYTRLFEAAWDGDIKTIQDLTERPWGENDEHDPLEISTVDDSRCSPFALAVLRGHYEAANEIYRILCEQYTPSNDTSTGYKVTVDYDQDETENETEDESAEESEDEDEDENSYGSGSDGLAPRVVKIADGKNLTFDIGENQDRSFKSSNSPKALFQESFQLYNGASLGLDSLEEPICKIKDLLEFSYNDLISHSIEADNKKMFDFLLEKAMAAEKEKKVLLQKQQMTVANRANGDMSEFTNVFIPSSKATWMAMGSEDSYYITKLIKNCGTGMPLDYFLSRVNKRINVANEKQRAEGGAPTEGSASKRAKFYQGLMVYGRKRSDWAARGAGSAQNNNQKLQNQHSLLIEAAFALSLHKIAWFLNDLLGSEPQHDKLVETLTGKPLESNLPSHKGLCLDFVRRSKKDCKFGVFSDAEANIEPLVNSWLNLNIPLVFHTTIIATKNDPAKRAQVLEYLCTRFPEHIDSRTGNGFTPLMLAFCLHQYDSARLLIEKGANQALRSNEGHNLAHFATYPPIGSLSPSDVAALVGRDSYRKMFGLIDSRLRGSIFIERCMRKPGALTPMHWLMLGEVSGEAGNQHRSSDRMKDRDMADIAKAILEFSGGEELEMVNGAGDTPLHTAVMIRVPETARVLVEHNPASVSRENAVGRTPVEIVNGSLNSLFTLNKPMSYFFDHYSTDWSGIQNYDLQKYKQEREWKEATSSTLHSLRYLYSSPNRVPDPEERYSYSTQQRHVYWRENQLTVSLLMLRKLQELVESVPAEKVGVRKLVTLHEANEVARRLAMTAQREEKEAVDGEDEKEGEEADENEEEDEHGYNKEEMSVEQQSRNRAQLRRRMNADRIVLSSMERQIPGSLNFVARNDRKVEGYHEREVCECRC